MSEPTFEIRFNSKEMQAFFAQFKATPEEIKRATVLALNDALPTMKKAALGLVTNRYALKNLSKVFKRSVKLIRASKTRLYIIFRGIGRGALPLSEFMIRNAKRAGISAQVLQSGNLTPLQKLSLHNGRVYKAFPIKGSESGKELVATRVPGTGKREAIKTFYGPGIASMLGKEENRMVITGAAVEKFKKRFAHHLAFILSKR